MMITVGNLIDQLTIANLKIWMLEDLKRDSDDDKTIADACRRTNTLNVQRNELIMAIDEALNTGGASAGNSKLYGHKS